VRESAKSDSGARSSTAAGRTANRLASVTPATVETESHLGGNSIRRDQHGSARNDRGPALGTRGHVGDLDHRIVGDRRRLAPPANLRIRRN